ALAVVNVDEISRSSALVRWSECPAWGAKGTPGVSRRFLHGRSDPDVAGRLGVGGLRSLARASASRVRVRRGRSRCSLAVFLASPAPEAVLRCAAHVQPWARLRRGG